MAKKRNCRRTTDENVIHDKAVKMRKMTDEQLVHYVEDRVEKARSEGFNQGRKKAILPKIDIAAIMDEIGAAKGIGEAKLGKIQRILERKLKVEDLEEQWKILKLPCKVGDIVYDVVLCDDGRYHIFKMRVCSIRPFGELRKEKVWNVYLEDDYTKAYRSFYDFGKTVFSTQEEALKLAKEKMHCFFID